MSRPPAKESVRPAHGESGRQLLLEPVFLSRLDRLAVIARKRVGNRYPGAHRGRALGASVDFADFRQYFPGDDFRRVDYQLYARLDRLFVRLFEAEEELLLTVVLDASASMGFDQKIGFASRVAGALCYLAGCRKDRARVWSMNHQGLQPSPWARSPDSALRAFEWLSKVQTGGASNLAEALKSISQSGGSAGMTVVISDFLTPQWEDALRLMGGPRQEAAVVHVLAPGERDPEDRGDLELRDSESGTAVEVSMSEQVLRQYRQRVESWLAAVSAACRRKGIHYSLADPSESLEAFVLKRLVAEGLIG